MRIALAVLLVFVAYAASYPSLYAADDEGSSDLDLKLRSILDELSEDRMERAVEADTDDEDDDEESSFSKRQGGHNVVGKETKCEIECVHAERFPKKGRGKTIGQAAKICKNRCVLPNSKGGGKKVQIKKPKHGNNIKTRSFIEDSASSEAQDIDRREFNDE